MIEDKEKRTREAILSVADLSGGRILEIGCGDGRVTEMLEGIPRQLVAMDPDKGCVETARGRVSGALFAAGSGQMLPFDDGLFDVVLFTLSLHHQDSARALGEAARVLAPGGRILAIEPEPDGEIERLCCLMEDESAELAAAAAALAEHPFAVTLERRFSTRFAFDDVNDLYRWLFSYYGRAFDEAVAEKVRRFLGPRSSHAPLILRDDLRIIMLEKGKRSQGTASAALPRA